MASEPVRHPLDQVLEEEVEAILKADPEFRESLTRTLERVRRGEAKIHEHGEVLRRMRELGVPVDDEPPRSPPSAPGR
jgi:hypothetical protein